jgi:hypothetical protein
MAPQGFFRRQNHRNRDFSRASPSKKKNSVQIRQIAPTEELKNAKRLAFTPGIHGPTSIFRLTG